MEDSGIKGSYGSSTVAKGLDVLDILGATKRPMTAAELAEALQLNVSSLYRILATLVKYGYLTNVRGTSKYFLGTKILALSSVILGQLDVRSMSRPILEDLMHKTGEATHLMMLDGNEGIYIERVESPQTIQMASNVGQREPLHASSVGKAILAHLPPDRLEHIIETTKLPRFTERTITDPTALKSALREIRERGYALDDMESEDKVRCIGAPVFDHDGKVKYSISVAGPAYRLTLKRLQSFAPDLLQAARAISRTLGHA